MTCAKTRVTARLVTPSGRTFYGVNDCAQPQTACPRITAGHGRDDYRLCLSVCAQPGHAEAMALQAAGTHAYGGIMHIAHHRACGACQKAMQAAGVSWVLTGDRSA